MWNWLYGSKSTASVRGSSARSIPRLERLEARIVLAANVAAYVSNGDLIVTGDNRDADIAISQPRPGEFILTGGKINGSDGPATFSGVTRDLRINLGSGNDSLTIDNSNPITVPGNFSIQGGQGSNSVITLGGSSAALNVAGNLCITNLPGGAQIIDLGNLNVNGNVEIRNHGGDAVVEIDTDGADAPNTIRGNLLISNGPGKIDSVRISSIHVSGDVRIRNQAVQSMVSIVTPPTFDDMVPLPNIIRGSVQIANGQEKSSDAQIVHTEIGRDLQVTHVGPGSSKILVLSSKVSGVTNLRGSNGDDAIVVNDATFGGDFRLQTGRGSDTVSIGSARPVMLYRAVVETRTKAVQVTEGGRTYTITVNYFVVKTAYENVVIDGGQVTFTGDMRVKLGAGADELKLALDADVAFKKTAIVDADRGHDTAIVRTDNLSGLRKLRHFLVKIV